ncbi:LysM peptidoglycan-binding domain-containing protein [bacterium]|nr:LysM peptidoglycan-binding domain-containing protein [bacterium]
MIQKQHILADATRSPHFLVWGLSLAFLGISLLFLPSNPVAEPRITISEKRDHAFRVPSQLRPRVQFWIDIFSKYGKHHAVIHHRMYPQVIFDVLDFYEKADTLSEVALEKYRKKVVKKRIAEVDAAIKWLSRGKAPRDPFEKHISQQMAVLGGGTRKYREVVQEGWVRSQRGIRERYRVAIERSGRYIHILERVFVLEYGLPLELTRLPFVESSFDYKAYSSVGAAGIWQFMPATGRSYNLRVSRIVDERRDVTAATKAAARYLSDAYKRLGSWPLAVTSYNHGVAGVARKVKKMGTKNLAALVERSSDQPFGFASQNFFPELLAAIEIYENVSKYFPGVQKEPAQEIARRKLTRAVTASELSNRLSLSIKQLSEVNYALHSSVWKGRYAIPAGYTLNVPLRYRTALANLKLPAAPASSLRGSRYLVRRGDTLGRIAQRYRTTVAKLKALNGLRSDVVRVGQTLVVSSSGGASSQASGSHTYRVRSGDTLFGIARTHRTTVASLQRANGMRSSRIRVGQVLKLPAGAHGASHSSAGDILYRVKRGDSLWGIARKYGVSLSTLKSRNKLRSTTVRVGQKIYIPRS